MKTLTKRLEKLELRQLSDNVRPALVQVIGPEGPSAAQDAAEALAVQSGKQVIRIVYKDASLAAIAVA